MFLRVLALVWFAQSATVIMIRHGEKDAKDDLSHRGIQRAWCLARLLSHQPFNISHIYAFNDRPSRRAVQTVTPLAGKLDLAIDTTFGRNDVSELASQLAALSNEVMVLVCWEHKYLSLIAAHLGIHPAPKYRKFDLVWIVLDKKLHVAQQGC